MFLCIWIYFLEKERDGVRVGSWDGCATLSPTPSLVVGNVPVTCLFWKWLETPNSSGINCWRKQQEPHSPQNGTMGFPCFGFCLGSPSPRPLPVHYGVRKKNCQSEVYIRFTIAVNNFIDVVYRLPCFPVIFCTYPTCSYMEIFLWTW